MARFVVLLVVVLLGMQASQPVAASEADKVVERMRGISMQASHPRSDGKPDPRELRRNQILDELRAQGKEAIPALVGALNDSDVQMRRNATLALVSLAGPYEKKPRLDIQEALPELIKATQDIDTDVRAWSAHAIAEIGPDAKTAVPALVKLLKDKEAGPRNTSCMALGAIGPAAKDALPQLRVSLEDPVKDVRSFARAAITRIEADTPQFNQVYVKIIMPTAPADRDKNRPVVESWIAEDLKKLGQAKFSAVTEWVPLDLSPLEATSVWDGRLGDKSYCPVHADIPERAEGRIKVLLIGWHPGGGTVTASLTDEPGSRTITKVEELKTEQGMPYVAILIGPPPEKPTAPTDRKK